MGHQFGIEHLLDLALVEISLFEDDLSHCFILLQRGLAAFEALS